MAVGANNMTAAQRAATAAALKRLKRAHLNRDDEDDTEGKAANKEQWLHDLVTLQLRWHRLPPIPRFSFLGCGATFTKINDKRRSRSERFNDHRDHACAVVT